MPDDAMARVTFGVAGVMTTDPAAAAPDDRWLHEAFRVTDSTAVCTWHGDGIVAVTYEHVEQAGTLPGRLTRTLPRCDRLYGLLVGHFFEPANGEPRGLRATRSVLSRFDREGISCFRQVNGGWVGILWDEHARTAHFVRDAVGSSGLYAARLPGRIVFASDLRIFGRLGLLDARDDQALAEFLHYLYVPAPRTIARGVLAVHAGHVLTIGESVRHERFSAPRFVEGPITKHPADLAVRLDERLPEFEERLLTAVSDCLPSTGRVVVALSGGQDSSTLAVALSKLCPDRTLALTVGERSEHLTEAPHAAMVCAALGLPHQCYVPSDHDLAAGVREFARHQAQPVGDLAAFPYFLGLGQLPDDCSVVLDGSGNDDYFGITGTDQQHRYKLRHDLQRWIPRVAWPHFVKYLSHVGGLRRLCSFWSKPIEESFVSWEGWSADELSRLFGRDISFAQTRLWAVMREGDPAHWRTVMTDVIGGIWEAECGFAKGALAAGAHGKLLRFPFIDERLASFVHRLPMDLKLDKQIMRAYMARNLPPAIVDKPKSGFIFDLNRLFLNPEYDWADALRRSGALRAVPDWSTEPIDTLLRSYAEAPDSVQGQHRLYALCLLASVLEVTARAQALESEASV
jgi:asparagine synthase (glutamine-hydrolysing)